MADTPRRTCGTMDAHRRLLGTSPRYARARAEIETLAYQYERRRLRTSRSGIGMIPVVVHVVFNTREQNLPSRQVQSQIDVLNADYRMRNGDVSNVPEPFRPLAADVRIEFRLATVDPEGNPTNGITRTASRVKEFPVDDSMKFSSRGGADAWPRGRYLNMWVCPLAGGVLGYAQLPGAPSAIDGVVINHTAFGTFGTAVPPFDKGRTTTHEVGHWLNLLHIWGDDGTGCSGSDFVEDTPNQAGPNYGVPSFPHVSCDNGPDGDMFMNFMDYTDDACMCMFTAGQVRRMDATLDGPRRELLGGTPQEPVAEGRSRLVFHDRAAGETASYLIDSEGAVTAGPASTGGDESWDLMATVAVGPEHGALLLYDRAAGRASLFTVDGDGALTARGEHDVGRTTWDGIAGVPVGGERGGLLFYGRAAGEAAFFTVDGEGNLTAVADYKGWRTSWDAVVGVPFAPDRGGVLLYDRTAGEAMLYISDVETGLTAGPEYKGWRTGWDVLTGVPVGGERGGLLAYDRSAGDAAFYTVDTAGSFVAGPAYTRWRTTWEQIVAVPLAADHGALLFYDRSAGEALFYRVDGEGNLSAPAQHGNWRRTWDGIAALAPALAPAEPPAPDEPLVASVAPEG